MNRKWQISFEVWDSFSLLVALNTMLRNLTFVSEIPRKLVKAFGLTGYAMIVSTLQKGNC